MEQEKEEKKSKIIQTYAGDMVQVIENDREGLIKKIIHGEEEYEDERKNLSPESKKNKFFMFLSLFLILVAMISLFYLFFRKNVSTVSIEKQFVPIIFTDKSVLVEVSDLEKDGIKKKVLNEINSTSIKNRGVEGIYLTFNKNFLGLRKFIETIDGNFVAGSGNFVDDNFLMGVVNNETKDFFILLKMRSISDIFNAIYTWENKIFSDLHGFLGIEILPETKYLLTKSFEDGIVENKNARILYDANNKIVIMYIFADDNSVIITNTNDSAREIMLRIASSQIKK